MGLRTYRWSSSNESDRFTVEDPSTGEVIALVQGGGVEEVDAAVRAAHAAYESDWRWRQGRERGVMLREIAHRLRRHAKELAALETRENGKPLLQSRMDVEGCIASFDYFGGVVGKLPGDFFNSGLIYGATLLEPYGVVGAILPFNWPPIHTAGKSAPALAVGNTLVLKPPEQTPLTVLRIVDIMQEVLPPDVVQVVPGRGATGAALAGHPLVRKLSFTGATRTGAAVVKQSADNTTPTLLELGGKNALIVLEDADVELALKGALEAGFYNQGEACTAGSRLLVHRSLHDTVVARLSAAVARLKVGAGSAPGTHVGPLVTRQHQQRVLDFIRIGQEEGARIAAQAPLPDDPALAGGYFVAPTLFVGVRPEMRIAREEIFGPVVCVIAFDDFEEAMRIANDTDYGLVSAVYTRDHVKAMRAARRLDVGVVFINNYFRGVSGIPFGGAKASGYGREHTLGTLEEFGRTKAISMVSGLGELPVWQAVLDVGL